MWYFPPPFCSFFSVIIALIHIGNGAFIETRHETSLETGIRELKEEMRVFLDPSRLREIGENSCNRFVRVLGGYINEVSTCFAVHLTQEELGQLTTENGITFDLIKTNNRLEIIDNDEV